MLQMENVWARQSRDGAHSVRWFIDTNYIGLSIFIWYYSYGIDFMIIFWRRVLPISTLR